MVVKHFTGIRADHALRAAVQQLDAQLFFKLAQLLGKGGLGHMQYQCRARQGSMVDDGDEVTQLAKFHYKIEI